MGEDCFLSLSRQYLGEKVSPRIEGYAHAVGMVLLIALIILVTFKDIGQFFLK